jgi:hypothetical protein
LVIASVATMGGALAADQWFVLGQKTIKAADPSTEIKSEGGRWDKDVKQVKLSVEGAGRADHLARPPLGQPQGRHDAKCRTLKSGGETAPNNAPGRKGRLTSVTIQYKILGGAPTADVKVWGYD